MGTCPRSFWKIRCFLGCTSQSGQCKEDSQCSPEPAVGHGPTVVGLDRSVVRISSQGFQMKNLRPFSSWGTPSVDRAFCSPLRRQGGSGTGLEWGGGPEDLTEDPVIELPFYWGEKDTNITLQSKAGCCSCYKPGRDSPVKNGKTLLISIGYGVGVADRSEFNESSCI